LNLEVPTCSKNLTVYCCADNL